MWKQYLGWFDPVASKMICFWWFLFSLFWCFSCFICLVRVTVRPSAVRPLGPEARPLGPLLLIYLWVFNYFHFSFLSWYNIASSFKWTWTSGMITETVPRNSCELACAFWWLLYIFSRCMINNTTIIQPWKFKDHVEKICAMPPPLWGGPGLQGCPRRAPQNEPRHGSPGTPLWTQTGVHIWTLRGVHMNPSEMYLL